MGTTSIAPLLKKFNLYLAHVSVQLTLSSLSNYDNYRGIRVRYYSHDRQMIDMSYTLNHSAPRIVHVQTMPEHSNRSTATSLGWHPLYTAIQLACTGTAFLNVVVVAR